jgi:two-component system cell cycle response regulator
MKILVAEDTKTNLAVITAILTSFGHEVLPAISGEEALNVFKNNRPDLIILDVVMKGIDGYECARRIRAIDPNDWIPIIFLSASIEDDDIAQGIDAGGDDYLTKPYSEIRLASKIRAMERIAIMRKKLFELTQQLQVLSTTDRLTGLYNRLYFEKSMHDKIAEGNRYEHKFALLYMDLDKFKIVNDTLGHHIGDLLLQAVAKRLQDLHRENDIIARLGGDEFAVILGNLKQLQDAGDVANKIIHSLSEEYFLENHKIIIGISIGIAIYPFMGTTDDELIKNADAALYQVKESGRNNYKYFIDLKNIQSAVQ